MAQTGLPSARFFRSPSVFRTIALHFAGALILATLCWVSAAAQYTTGSLGGTIQDTAGAVVPGAEVTVQNEDTGLSRNVATKPDGTFLFPALTVGRYRLTVAKSG